MGMNKTTRDWRVCGWVEMSYPKRFPGELPQIPKSLTWATEYKPHKDALDDLWNARSTVKGKRWIIWIEPRDMTEDERNYYVPYDVRNSGKQPADTAH